MHPHKCTKKDKIAPRMNWAGTIDLYTVFKKCITMVCPESKHPHRVLLPTPSCPQSTHWEPETMKFSPWVQQLTIRGRHQAMEGAKKPNSKYYSSNGFC